MQTIDCLFIHPSAYERKKCQYNCMPMGLVALANVLNENGFKTKIVHPSLEKSLSDDFNLMNYIRGRNPLIVAIDLHWFHHSYNAIQLAKLSKTLTNALVVLGGFTASFFSRQILQDFSFVDIVIRGDAEAPLIKVAQNYLRNKKLDSIPNITFRQEKKIRVNKIGYIAKEQDINRLDFVNFKLLEHYSEYFHFVGKELAGVYKDAPPFFICVGRGCTFNCTFCGGSRLSHRFISGRMHPIFRSINKVGQDIIKLKEQGIKQLHIDFDPYPKRRTYYFKLFKWLKREKIDVGCNFVTWHLPNQRFLQDFSNTFDVAYSLITVSPDSGAEKIRQLNKGPYYSNSELARALLKLEKMKLKTEVFFSLGHVNETLSDFASTVSLALRIRQKHKSFFGPYCSIMELEPCSLRYLFPRKYGIKRYWRSFYDFYHATKEKCLKGKTTHPFGYSTKFMSEQTMEKLQKNFNSFIKPRFPETVIDHLGII